MAKQTISILFVGLLILSGCIGQPAREQVNMSLPLRDTRAIDLNASLARAQAEHKIILLEFTGSDWCPPCRRLHNNVFARPEFASYAQSNLIFLVVDFPSKYRMPPEANATNDWLASKFGVVAFPTVIALDGEENKLWRHLGYLGDDGAKEWMSKLEALKAKAK